MSEQTPGTTQPPAEQQPNQQQQPGQGTASAPAPSTTQKSTEQQPASTQPASTQQPSTQQPQQPPVSVQERINRMYARLQAERNQRKQAEAEAAALRATSAKPKEEGEEDDEEGVQQPKQKPLTEQDVQSIIQRQEMERDFHAAERRVLERHPTALNEDGTFNMSDPFVVKYIEIGRHNPQLTMMANGPELAEAMAERELGITHKPAQRTQPNNPANTFTGTSTTAPVPNNTQSQLNDVEKRTAARMGLTEAEYQQSKTSNKVSQKSWEIKP